MPYSETSPWILEREATVCGWKPDYNRGFFNNMNVDIKTDFFSFSNRQLHEYVKMMKASGFTGMQFNDSTDKWRFMGSWESVHDRFKTLCDCLHEEGMHATLSVMGAAFHIHGWTDDEICYTPKEGYDAFTDPKVHACFEKYYRIYADLAPYVDRLIIRFFDPGVLTDYPVIFRYANLLADMFRKENPNVKFGIDTWGCPADFPTALVKEPSFRGMTLLELPFPPRWAGHPEKRAAFRQGVKDLGCELGAWGWYTIEKEVDQSGSMYVNAKLIKEIYNLAREQGDHVMIPTYWSEMDSNHTMNIFSLYCAGQLLINPDRDPDELLHEVARKVFGPEHEDDAFFVLNLIQDARTGSTWSSYWLDCPNLILGGLNPEDISARASYALEKIKSIAADKQMTHELPLPVEPQVIARLIIPMVDQIKRLADFRIELKKLDERLAAGAQKSELYAAIDELWQPVPDFNGIVGVWGQIEDRVMFYHVRDFCQRAGIEIPKKPARTFLWMKRYYEHMGVIQRGHSEPVHMHRKFFEGGYPFLENNELVLCELERLGVINRDEEGKVWLADWENYKYDFCF